MRELIAKFFQEEDGAVTVDFVVLTAAICLLGFVIVITFSGSLTDLTNYIVNSLNNMQAS